MKRKYAITGGAGFIGSSIARALLKHWYNEIVICDVGNPRNPYLDEMKLDGDRVTLMVADIRDLKALESAFVGVDGVFHCAAYSKIGDCIQNPDLAVDVNVKGTLNVLLAAKKNGVRRVVYSASASVYGDLCSSKDFSGEHDRVQPMNIYGLSKYFGELLCGQFCERNGLDTVSLRYFNVFGSELAVDGRAPCPSVVEIFLKRKRDGQPLTITNNGSQERDLVHVDAVAAANLEAMRYRFPLDGAIFNIGTGKPHSIAEIAKMVGGPVVYVPKRYSEPKRMSGRITYAKGHFGFTPDLDAVPKFIAAMKEKYGI